MKLIQLRHFDEILVVDPNLWTPGSTSRCSVLPLTTWTHTLSKIEEIFSTKTSPNLKFCFIKIAHRATYIQLLWQRPIPNRCSLSCAKTELPLKSCTAPHCPLELDNGTIVTTQVFSFCTFCLIPFFLPSMFFSLDRLVPKNQILSTKAEMSFLCTHVFWWTQKPHEVLGPLKHMRFQLRSGSIKTHEVLRGENFENPYEGPSNHMRFWVHQNT